MARHRAAALNKVNLAEKLALISDYWSPKVVVVELAEGEFCIVPRGVEHKPVALHEACVLLLEPAATSNTGNVREARTREELERV